MIRCHTDPHYSPKKGPHPWDLYAGHVQKMTPDLLRPRDQVKVQVLETSLTSTMDKKHTKKNKMAPLTGTVGLPRPPCFVLVCALKPGASGGGGGGGPCPLNDQDGWDCVLELVLTFRKERYNWRVNAVYYLKSSVLITGLRDAGGIVIMIYNIIVVERESDDIHIQNTQTQRKHWRLNNKRT